MSEEQRYETQRMDHYGIVAGICHEIGLVEEIDQIVDCGERKVSCSEAILAMVLNGLGFSSRVFVPGVRFSSKQAGGPADQSKPDSGGFQRFPVDPCIDGRCNQRQKHTHLAHFYLS